MSETYTTPALTPTKPKTKFCFAAIPAAMLTASTIFSTFMAITTEISYNIYHPLSFWVWMGVLTVSILFLTVLLFIRKLPKLTAIAFSVWLIFNDFDGAAYYRIKDTINIIKNGFESTTALSDYIFSISKLLAIIIPVVTIFMLLSKKSAEKRTKKAKVLTSLKSVVIYFVATTVMAVLQSCISFQNSYPFYFADTYIEYLFSDPIAPVNLFTNIFTPFCTSVFVFLFLLWLADPYKKPKAPRRKKIAA